MQAPLQNSGTRELLSQFNLRRRNRSTRPIKHFKLKASDPFNFADLENFGFKNIRTIDDELPTNAFGPMLHCCNRSDRFPLFRSLSFSFPSFFLRLGQTISSRLDDISKKKFFQCIG
jgi:hypothetical protein